MSNERAVWIILIAAAITLLLRACPFIIFGKNRRMPARLVRLGQLLPSAIMAVLVVYCLKDSGPDWMGVGLPKLLGVAITALCYKLSHRTLPSICAGTAGYMLLIRLL